MKNTISLSEIPYGEHRGYKGLGEEPKISKYEDYFVKRGIDTLKIGGVLAMVLPSGWLDRQKLSGADLINAYRLPRELLQEPIGTDIIIQKISKIFSQYFKLF